MPKSSKLLNIEEKCKQAGLDINVMPEFHLMYVTVDTKEAVLLGIYELNMELRLYAFCHKCDSVVFFIKEKDGMSLLFMSCFVDVGMQNNYMDILHMAVAGQDCQQAPQHQKRRGNYQKETAKSFLDHFPFLSNIIHSLRKYPVK